MTIENPANPPAGSNGWFKTTRGNDALELIRLNPLAYILAAMIAHRARWRDGFNADGLGPGEAKLGDFKSYGMSARQYRTAKDQLAKWQFATFKTTNKGTIGKLIDTRLFNPLNAFADEQNDSQPTSRRQASDKQPTTNEEGKKEKKEINHVLSADVLPAGKKLVEVMERCREVLGAKELKLNHRRWYDRAESDPRKLMAVLNDTANKVKEDGLSNPAAWAETMWKTFK